MKIFFQPTDWYHCNIYKRRFFFFYELIANAELSIKGDINLYIHNPQVIFPLLPAVALQAKDFIISQRED